MKNFLLNTTALHSPEGAGSAASAEGTPGDQNASPADDVSSLLSEEKIKEIIEFDPFGPPEEPAAAEPAATAAPAAAPASGDGKPEDISKPPASQAGTQPTTVQETPEQKELREARETISRLTTRVTELATAPRKEEPTSPEAGEVPEWVKPYTAFQIPDQFMAALDGEDASLRRVALTRLIQAVVVRAVGDARKHVEEAIGALRNEVPTLASTHIRAQTVADEMMNDFTGNFQALKSPRLKDLVLGELSRVGQSWTQQGRQFQWAELRDHVGGQLMTELGLQAAAQPPAGNGAAPQRQPARTQSLGGNGSRPTIATTSEFGADLL